MGRWHVGLTPGIHDGEHWEKMGKAFGLFVFLIDKQTPGGRVNYGKPITYRWIADEMENAPCERTLRRYMAALRRHGYIETQRVNYQLTRCRGMIVTICNPKKWAEQLQMFPVEKAVEIHQNHRVLDRTKSEYCTGQKWPDKRFRRKIVNGQKQNSPATPPAPSPPDENHKKRIAARDERLLGDLAIARELAAGGPVDWPRSFRQVHPELREQLVATFKKRAM